MLLNSPDEKELNLRLDVELVKGNDTFLWGSLNGTKYTGNNFQPLATKNETTEGGISYIYGFESLTLKSNFFELTPKILNDLSNTILSIKIMMPVEGGGGAAVDPKTKGKAPAAATPAAPTEQPIVDISIPFKSILKIRGSGLELEQVMFENLSSYGINFLSNSNDLQPSQSFLNLKVYSDNQLAEYTLGCRSITWQSAKLTCPPPAWALHYADVIDPKAKVPPTPADLRTKYIENITRLVSEQSKVASYVFLVGGGSRPATVNDSDETEATVNQQIQQYFPTLELSQGKINFDRDQATENVTIEEDIRQRSDLWSSKLSRLQLVMIFDVYCILLFLFFQ